MKKCFLAVITALSLAGFSYAQDDEYEEEEVVYEEEAEEEAPAVKKQSKQQVAAADEEEEEEAEEAPAPKKKKKASKPRPAAENGTFGIGAELTGLNSIRIVYNLNADMAIVGLLGFNYNSWSNKQNSVETDDSNWGGSIGAGFAYTLGRAILPMYAEGDLFFGTTNDDHTYFGIDLWFGARATVVKSLELSGQLGLGYQHNWWDEGEGAGKIEHGTSNISLKTKVYATWYFM